MASYLPVREAVVHHTAETIKSQVGGLSDVYKGKQPSDRKFEAPSAVLKSSDWSRSNVRELIRIDDPGGGKLDLYWRTSKIDGPLMLSLYTDTKTQRATLYRPLRRVFMAEPSSFSSGLPPEGLVIKLSKHYDADARITLTDGSPRDSQTRRDGLWRRDLELRVETEELEEQRVDKAQYSSLIDTEIV